VDVNFPPALAVSYCKPAENRLPSFLPVTAKKPEKYSFKPSIFRLLRNHTDGVATNLAKTIGARAVDAAPIYRSTIY
jgi:hypothetical protein